MNLATRRSEIGDTVKARHPRKRDLQVSTVTWVSPTTLTVQVRFADGTVGFEFPEHDGVWIQSERAKRWHATNDGLKADVARGKASAEEFDMDMGEVSA